MTLQLRVLSNFPANVSGNSGISVSKENGEWTVEPQLENLSALDVLNNNLDLWGWNRLTGEYYRVNVTAFASGSALQPSDIGVTVQGYNTNLAAIAGLVPVADRLAYYTGASSAALTPFTAFARSLVDDADAAAARTTLVLGNVDNTSDASKPVSTAQQTALDLKANLASPTFTGTPAGPTAAPGTNTTQLATTAFVLANGASAGVASIDGSTGALTTDTTLEVVAGVLKVSDAGIPWAKFATSIYDPVRSIYRLGSINLMPTPQTGTGVFLGNGNLLWGSDQLSSTNNQSALNVMVGAGVGENAKIYGSVGIGFRNLSALTLDGTGASGTYYVTSVGIDSFTYATRGDAATGIGAHTATFKSNINASTTLGAFSAFGSGDLIRSVIIGMNACYGDLSTTSTSYTPSYSITDAVVVGHNAAIRLKGTSNTVAIGKSALGTSAADVTGNGNTVVGASSGTALTSGVANTFVGYESGGGIATSLGTVCVGWQAGATGDYGNSVALGYQASITASNHIVLGNSSISSLRCQQTSITALSDARDKTDKQPLSLGLDFINEIKPTRFTWAIRDEPENANNGRQEAGIIAQQLLATAQKYDAEWMGLVDDSDPDRLQATPHKLLFPLIRAVQELSAKVDAQAARITELEAA